MLDCVVVGCGPAGMTAALYLLRAGKSVLMIEQDSIGGQIAKSPRLENYPSIPSISGLEFADNLFNQVTDLGAEFELDKVEGITKEEGLFHVKTSSNEFISKTVIIASGCDHRELGLVKEKELVGHGISYCAVCDGAFFAGQDVVLIGDANTAIQYAISLSATSSNVFVATLFDRFFADEILVQRMKGIKNITYRHCLNTKEFLGEKELEGIVFEDTKTKELVTVKAKGAFIAIGQIPHNEPFKNLVDLDPQGFIIVDEDMATKTEGLFAVGDCRKKSVRQVITAVNDAAIAAIKATKYC